LLVERYGKYEIKDINKPNKEPRKMLILNLIRPNRSKTIFKVPAKINKGK
tara:strand:- start:177 stop:326 length:150 start_codon:yes stop_codon:yes gene_type:complete